MNVPATLGRACRLLAAALLPLYLVSELDAADHNCLNASIRGHVIDFTRSRECDRRVWSQSLSLPRDMLVYLPPDYDANQAYPLFLWLHGFGGDEEQFARQVVRALDSSIATRAMPPVIAVCPDCSVPSWWKPWRQGSWCINGKQGQWEDYVVNDVMGFVTNQFKVRPEPEAHVIAGWSMGGFAAYNLAFKHPDKFRVIVGVSPNVNLRYADKDGHWGAPFSPETIGWLEELRWNHWLGRYPKPWRFPVNAGVVFLPAWGSGNEAIARMSQENPYEVLDRLDIQPGQYDMYIAYGRQDEYHVDNQVDSFLYKATERGLDIWVRYDPNGHHSTEYVNDCMPDVLNALGTRLEQTILRLSSVTETARTK
jgi:S-formylglutathione hydrolase FrmB